MSTQVTMVFLAVGAGVVGLLIVLALCRNAARRDNDMEASRRQAKLMDLPPEWVEDNLGVEMKSDTIWRKCAYCPECYTAHSPNDHSTHGCEAELLATGRVPAPVSRHLAF